MGAASVAPRKVEVMSHKGKVFEVTEFNDDRGKWWGIITDDDKNMPDIYWLLPANMPPSTEDVRTGILDDSDEWTIVGPDDWPDELSAAFMVYQLTQGDDR